MRVSGFLLLGVFLLGHTASSLHIITRVTQFFTAFKHVSQTNAFVILIAITILIAVFTITCATLSNIAKAERTRFWKERGDTPGYEERTQGRRSLVMNSDFKLSRSSYAYELFDPTLVNRLAASQNIS